MNISDFDFDLPDELIAQAPPAERGTSRLLVLDRLSGSITHTTIAELPGWLHQGDVLVVNNTRVFPARLLGSREPSGGAVEWLLLHRIKSSVAGDPTAAETWEALVHPGQKLKPGARVVFAESALSKGTARGALHGEVLERKFYGRRVVRLWTEDGSAVMDVVERLGHVPLPPYIKRPDTSTDRERYQTIYARHIARSVAAPTAGLHFTQGLLSRLRQEGINVVEITLDVGYGTFKPVRDDEVEHHVVDPESYCIESPAAAAINDALDDSRRIVAVGTTTTRALENAVRPEGRVEPGPGTADIFIYPGFNFRVVSALLTNFHLPRSSLLMLVSAFAGRDRVLAAYSEAIARQYRFYSYGDAMLIL